MIIETIGWIGAVLLATCGLPQLYKTIKTNNFSGLSIIFILWWFLGEIFSFTYIIYEAENRPAFRLFIGTVTKKIVKLTK